MPISLIKLAGILVAATCVSAIAIPAECDDRKLPPDATAQSVARERLNKKFDLAELRKKEEPGKLAGVMLQQAVDTTDDADLRFVLLLETRELAVEARDTALAMSSIDEMAKHYVVDVLIAKAGALQGLLKGAKTDDIHVSDQLEQLAEEALAADRYDVADDLVALAERLVGNDQELKKLHRLRRSEIRSMAQKFASMQQVLTDLEKSPADPELNLAAGQFRAYYKGDWQRGVPMLALGGNPPLADVALRDLRQPTAPLEIKQLADAWWNIAASEAGVTKKNIQNHATELYRKALPGLEGLDKLAVEKRLSEELRVAPKKPPVGRWVKIVNKNSGLAAGINVENGPRRPPYHAAKQYEFKADVEGHQWQFQPLADGYYKIVNKANGHILAIGKGSEEDGARAIVYPFNPSALDHQWKFEPTKDGSFRLVNRKSSKVLGIDRRSRSTGAELTQWALLKEDPADQHWQILPIGR